MVHSVFKSVDQLLHFSVIYNSILKHSNSVAYNYIEFYYKYALGECPLEMLPLALHLWNERTPNIKRKRTTNLTCKLRENASRRSLMFYIKRRLKMPLNPTLRQNFRRTKEWMAKPMLPSYPAPFHRFSTKKWKKMLERIFHNVQKTSFLSQKWWF